MAPEVGEMLDTPPEARRFYYVRLAALSPTERLAILFAQNRMVREVAEASIHRAHPGIEAGELRVRLAVRLYGCETVRRVLGDIPENAR